MRVRFLAAASEEFSLAVSYYDSQKAGPGDEFADEVWRAISRIVTSSCLAATLGKNDALSY